jgi:histidine triad (HIT) family protein
MESHCTFCDLIRGAAEVSICHEDADAIAFMDIQPVNNGHVLVVPREHYESLLDVPQEIGMHLFQVTMKLANAVRRVTGCDDLNIVVNSGKAAGQDEPHYHVHIIPRREGDGFDIPLPFNGSEMPDRTLLDAYAARIGSALRDPMKVEGSGGSRPGGESAPAAPRKTGARPRMTMRAADAPDSRNAAPAERAVALPTFEESENRKAQPPQPPGVPQPRKAGRWWLEEGPHGELRYEPVAELRDDKK